MLVTIIVMFTCLIISIVVSKWTSKIVKKTDSIREDEPFEFTEMNLTTPTPTPVYEKKKRGRKPKTTK